MSNRIRFVLNGQLQEARVCDPTETVLDFLRAHPNLRGSKEGCAEGDCGACTVVVGELAGDGLRYRALNACILFLATLDGKLLFTVEGLTDAQGSRHPVQQAMVDFHGSQCGFCTPGFVMSMFALFHDQAAQTVSRRDIDLNLAGNLCRCTGYAPIVRAAEHSLVAGRGDQFSGDLAAQEELLRTIRPPGQTPEPKTKTGFFTPASSAELCELLDAFPDALLVAGATDVGLWVTKQLREFPLVIFTGRVTELLEIRSDPGHETLAIGAAVTYSDALEPLAEIYPAFRPLMERLGAVQVRNAGTIGGNIANGSPIGDMPPGLIALGSQLVLHSSGGQRSMPLEDFFMDYDRQDLRSGEFVDRVLIPLPKEGVRFATYKLSKRIEQDISAVCAGFRIDMDGDAIARARIAFGGMAATPRRAGHCEAALEGQQWNRATIESAMDALGGDFEPISDMRASADYRLESAKNLLLRFFLEFENPAYPVGLSSRYGAAND